MENPSIENQAPDISLQQITTYQAGIMQAAVHRVLQKFCDQVLAAYGLTKMQWLVIGAVLDSGQAGIRISDLAERLGTTMPYITGEVNLLCAKSMLVKKSHPGDSRSKIVYVDNSFRPDCDHIEKSLREALRTSIYAGISPADFRVYIKVLYQLSSIKLES